MKFKDLNANGVKDAGRARLAGWTIRAYDDTNGDGILQAGETTIAASDDDRRRRRVLAELEPGKYVVCEVQQASWTQSLPARHRAARRRRRARRLRRSRSPRASRRGQRLRQLRKAHQDRHEVQRPERQRRQGRGASPASRAG